MFLELEGIHNQSFASLEVLNITDVDVARRMQVDLTRGYLFRPKTPSGWVVDKTLTPSPWTTLMDYPNGPP